MNYFYKTLFFITIIFAFDLELGSKMPEQNWALLNIDGQELLLDDIKGDKGTVVIFSSNTCPWVIRWEDRYVKIANKYKDKGVNIIAVNSNSARFNGSESLENMKQHSNENNYNFPYAQDPNSELAKAFGATKTPHVYLFNQNEKLVFKGAIDDNARNPNKVNHSYLMDAIEQMLNGEGIKKPTSKAMGCSIKFN